jgi:hypothetical protein
MKKFERVPLVYHITVHSCIDISDPADCRYFTYFTSLGVFDFSQEGALDLSETFAPQIKQYNVAITGRKVLTLKWR